MKKSNSEGTEGHHVDGEIVKEEQASKDDGRTTDPGMPSNHSSFDDGFFFDPFTIPKRSELFLFLFGRPKLQRPPAIGGRLPEAYVGFFSRSIFFWMQPFVNTGYKRPLKEADLFTLEGDYTAQAVGKRLDDAWESEKKRAEADVTKPARIWRALWAAFGFEIITLGIYRFVTDTTAALGPLVVFRLVQFLSNTGRAVAEGTTPPDVSYGYGYAVLLFATQIVSGWVNHKAFEKGMRCGFKIRSAITSTLYSKCLRLSPKGRQVYSQGRLMNSVSSDTGRMDRATAFLNLVWSVPYLIILSLCLLILTVGVSAIAGVALLVTLAPMQVFAMRHLARIRTRCSLITDKRVKTTQEAITGVRVMKLYSWENSFQAIIAKLRKKELREVRIMLLYRSAISSITTILPAFAAIVTFVTFSLTGGQLDAPTVFSALALFNILRIPCLLIPILATELTDAKVSLDRIDAIMNADELDSPPKTLPFGAENGLVVDSADFMWDVSQDDEAEEEKAQSRENLSSSNHDKARPPQVQGESASKFTLRDINITVPRGSLVAIVGAVGSGKSSLLNALVGEMKRLSGSVTFSGKVGYCPQTAWIENATLKDNIIFGQPFDEQRYQSVIKDCALARDLEVLPAGDKTEIGERGINLSGGQRQRVSIARACYFDADVVLLDDPLSAVDAHVGRYLFDNCLMGALKDKTRILVTHQLHFLNRVDHIFVMDEGRIVEHGTFEDLIRQGNGFARLVAEYGSADAEESKEQEESSSGVAKLKVEDAIVSNDNEADGQKKEADGILMTMEDRQEGNISGSVITKYIEAMGGLFILILIVLLVLIAQLARMGTDLWISWWSTVKYPLPNFVYLDVYVGYGGIQAVTAVASGVIFAYAGVWASERLHNRAMLRVLRAPTEFFDTTPLGRILNRFSKDVDTLDSLLPESARMLGYTFSLVIGTVALICAIFPYFLIVVAPVACVYWYLQTYYRFTSRELKRLDNVTRSPLFAHFASGLSGLATIRAYNVSQQFRSKNLELLDWNNRAYFPLIMTQRWLGLRLEALAAVLILACSIFAVALRFTVGAAAAGLAISYSLQVTGILNWCVRVYTDTEQFMVSAERMISFDELKQEAAPTIESCRPPELWPDHGNVVFENLQLRYREGLPLVLKGISLKISSGEKVAIVGRTGAGKSSIVLALMRLVEPCGGSITIDGVDVGKIGLHDLRSRIAVIPQDPVLFSGTLRMNLDPFDMHTDAQIWEALRMADLATFVSKNPKHLEMNVAEGGENWSTGQRQLICLARAMLRNSKVVILDEATASVDVACDDFIQKSIRRDFKGKTIITIAHRLQTIADYDKVLVLDQGCVAEFDSPAQLLKNPNGLFFSMCANTGDANAELLHKLANKEK